MTKLAEELRYAVRPRVILKYFGQFCLVIAVLTLVPLVVSLLYGETAITLRYLSVAAVLGVTGAGLARIKGRRGVQPNEAMVLVSLLFLVTPLIMSFPLMGSGLDFIDAFFEAVSGATTTGLSTTGTVAGKPSSFLFGRAWMQWYGGLGIVVLSLALTMRPGVTARSFAVTETEPDDLVGGTRAHARRTVLIYGILTAGAVAILLVAGVGPTDSLLYSLAAVSTGGFAPHDASLAGLSGAGAAVLVTIVGVAGALPFAYYLGRYKQPRYARVAILQVKALVIAGAVVTVLLAATMLPVGGSTSGRWLHPPLMAFSAQTTTGFSSVPPSTLNGTAKLLLIASMAIGGGIGSTAGGIKIIRILILFTFARVLILRISSAKHAVVEPRLSGRRLSEDDLREAMVLIAMFVITIFVSWIPFVGMGYDPLDSLFEVVSATATVGLSAGVTGPDLPAVLKGVLCADMLLGRLEIVAWLILLYPGTWFGRRLAD